MATVSSSLGNCGAALISGLYTPPENIILDVAKSGFKVTFFVFTDAAPPGKEDAAGGYKLRQYIKEHKLGHVTASPGWHPNVQHGPNNLKVYVWRVNQENFQAWKKAKGINY